MSHSSSPASAQKPAIAVLLPSREGFDPQHFGAIALCVKDFVEHSRYRDSTHIFGAISDSGFDGLNYQKLSTPQYFFQRLLQSRSKTYVANLLVELHKLRPALVEIHNRPNLVHLLAKHWHNPIALHLHNDPQEMKLAHTATERQWLLENCTMIYCVSDYIKQRFIDGTSLTPALEAKVKTVHNGITLPIAATPKQKHITFVGRLQPEKGALEFVEALHRLLPQHPDWKGVMIGAARHDPKARTTAYAKNIYQLLEKADIPIEMKGFCSHAETLENYSTSEIAIIPSCWNEAFGRTALEAMACGCATISSTRGGLEEVIGDAALRLKTITADTVANALSTFITESETRQAYQQKALRQAEEYNIIRCTADLDAARKTVIG